MLKNGKVGKFRGIIHKIYYFAEYAPSCLVSLDEPLIFKFENSALHFSDLRLEGFLGIVDL